MGKQKDEKDYSANNYTASLVIGIPGLHIWFKLKTKQKEGKAFLQNKVKIIRSFLSNLLMFTQSPKL